MGRGTGASCRGLPESARNGRELIELGAIERGDERRNRAGRRDPGELGPVVEDAGGTPRVAEILEGQEAAADGLGRGPVPSRAGVEERTAQGRCDAAGAGGEAGQV